MSKTTCIVHAPKRKTDIANTKTHKLWNNFIKTSKYSLVTFVPQNLFEQFQRLANFYFLCLLVLQLIPQISSLTAVTTAVPLAVVLTVTALKDAIDDFQRHRSDSQVNNRLSHVLREGRLLEERWYKVQVGDIVRMENDQFVAADLLLLSTSEPNGLCYIETAELDGETNLKCRQALPETAEMGEDHALFGKFTGDVICEPPNNNLSKYEGTLLWEGRRTRWTTTRCCTGVRAAQHALVLRPGHLRGQGHQAHAEQRKDHLQAHKPRQATQHHHHRNRVLPAQPMPVLHGSVWHLGKCDRPLFPPLPPLG
ncbi:phospholipid-transporting ATPase ID [Caerostris extrusa]|uniref:Phospholipid-transporting ATPase ID n=1 Tax=Caerostris extrusa TaxID=172846 RepID=A0AAV4Y0D8_CAEEX|nr:phospholipid-transporting ATPase ID [Caerostris extrusa]